MTDLSDLTVRMPYVYQNTMRKTFKHRLYPTKQQQHLLAQQLEECRWLYNHLLAERKMAWEERQEAVRLYDQQGTGGLINHIAQPIIAALGATQLSAFHKDDFFNG